MFKVIRSLRACRPIFQILDVTERFSNHLGTSQQRGLKILNLHLLCEIRATRLFSTEADQNYDPLFHCDAIYPVNNAQLAALTNNEPERVKRLRVLQMELAVKNAESPHIMPKKILLEHWKVLLVLSRTARPKYLACVRRKEVAREEKQRQKDSHQRVDQVIDDHERQLFEYKVFRNALFPMIHPNCINAALSSRLVSASLFSPVLVMDCGYENVMNIRELKNAAQQLSICLGFNKIANKPFNTVFCNLKKDSSFEKELWSAVPNLFDSNVPILTYESCYTALYPKQKLVYLTPHCREMIEFNPEDIYIMGAIVDKSNPAPHTLIKAKSQGLRMGCLPIDKYVLWKTGTKSLTLDQVIRILLTRYDTGDWTDSFSKLPRRKILDTVPQYFPLLDKRRF